MTQAKGVENDAVSAAPLAAPSDALYRRIVESIADYAIFMLDPSGQSRPGTPGASDQGLRGGRDHRRALLALLSAGAQSTRRAGARARDRAVAHGRFEDEGWRIRKDGSRFWANVVITRRARRQRRARSASPR